MKRIKLILLLTLAVLTAAYGVVWTIWPTRTAGEFVRRFDAGEFRQLDEVLPEDGRWTLLVMQPGALQIEPRTAADWLYGRRRFSEVEVGSYTCFRLSVQRGKVLFERRRVIPEGQQLWRGNSPATTALLQPAGWLRAMTTSTPDNIVLVEMLYQRILERSPTADERQRCVEHIQKQSNRNEAFEDIAWALFNSKEFLFPELLATHRMKTP